MRRMNNENGFVLIATLLMLAVLMAMMGAFFVTTNIEIASAKASKDSLNGFYGAEAGLNVRAEAIRQRFIGFNRPDGSSPTSSGACQVGNLGSGDFACETLTLGNQEIKTYISEDANNPYILTIPPGELYQNLSAQEYRYTVNSVARGVDDRIEAILELRFKSRLVPLFQFAAFYNKDLEILPGPDMTLAGPVHTNGDLYLDAGSSLTVQGQVTSAGQLYRGRKNDSTCKSRPVGIFDPINSSQLLPSCAVRTLIESDDVASWNGMIQMEVDELTVPEPEVFDAEPGRFYWDKADLRLVLALDGSNAKDTSNSPTGVEVRTVGNSVAGAETNTLNDKTTCPGSIEETAAGANDGYVAAYSNTFYSNREEGAIRMLDIDMRALLNCLHTTNFFGSGKALSDDTEGGLVFHFTVKGPNSANQQNYYGVRIRNGAELQSNISGAPLVKGLSVVSDQAAYVYGSYNENPDEKIPAAIMVDAFNVLSSAWRDANSQNWSLRVPVNTVIRSAILSGTDSTGGVEGAGGQGGSYNGGLENYPRFHEQWSKSPQQTLVYRGSFVSLGRPRHSAGSWQYGSPDYTAPVRDWGYDTDFNDAANLPPITPRFVYLRQELFVRDYKQ